MLTKLYLFTYVWTPHVNIYLNFPKWLLIEFLLISNVEAEVLMLEFSTKKSIRNIPPEGKHYKGVIGKHYSILNSFMIRKNINGPSWLRINGILAANDTKNKSNFITFNLNSEDDIEPLDSQAIPALSVLSVHTEKFAGRVGAVSFGIAYSILILPYINICNEISSPLLFNLSTIGLDYF